MGLVHLFCFLWFCHLMLILSSGHGSGYQSNCPPSFTCGNRGIFRYPFTKAEQPDCGLIFIYGCGGSYYSPKLIQLEKNAKNTELTAVIDQNTITLSDPDFYKRLQHNVCDTLNHNYTLPPPSPLVSFYINYNVTLFQCNHSHNFNPPSEYFKYNCPSFDIYYDRKQHSNVTKEKARSFFSSCSLLQFPSKDLTDTENILSFVSGQMVVKIVLSADCEECCNHRGGQCRLNANNKFYCHNGTLQMNFSDHIFHLLMYGLLIKLLSKWLLLQSRRIREIILSCYLDLCTSHHSDELLLVYEYVPNHTVDFHLQGDLARIDTLPWHIRMKIAIETASVLAYLHASGIIHRDVKTKNILLTNSFSVKVADFGLSRLFPHDITHASTTPQGTPGYVDPDYHQCYQLTNKSDVYSFGVVLVELISSKLAVDMNRHKDEINLSNLALKKIQKGEFTELVDPNLGFDSDNEVKRMIVSVAELAFQCLQREKELRPSMDEVLR
ncbi:serine/threonine-protein kinase KIN2 [Lathyrus oleraceus]|uniref:serine/threonine-protein kinase KIN2 n=1 Tax=Pisum sativum TaxID=3888 RepID=UPI0021D0FE98|nr:serine/threonine-protein kinase KIN2-like [Pisum sativum]